ncbi:uncharacterized protein LOC118686146 isoform X3 [Molothrus ater]|uniref:uncharacterized protein LOC118686146 isoform X3 n=1 Tax=Molothrus ater TaxID=84834 RepID=UPI001748CDB6|nr:uncharacterized protein LOC118686146 isoform X3 [Molothrus ater]
MEERDAQLCLQHPSSGTYLGKLSITSALPAGSLENSKLHPTDFQMPKTRGGCCLSGAPGLLLPCAPSQLGHSQGTPRSMAGSQQETPRPLGQKNSPGPSSQHRLELAALTCRQRPPALSRRALATEQGPLEQPWDWLRCLEQGAEKAKILGLMWSWPGHFSAFDLMRRNSSRLWK